MSRGFAGEIKTVTISKTPTGKYFASVLVEDRLQLPSKEEVSAETTIGVDLGLTRFATLDTSEIIENPKFLNSALIRLKVLQRRLSKKLIGSKNRIKARLKVARQYEKISNQRLDFLHKLTYRLTHESQVDTICMEDLCTKGMVRNHRLARQIVDTGWGMFRTLLEYKCDWYGKNLIFVDRFFPSSKRCNQCRWINEELNLGDRFWRCQVCHSEHDREENAAINIRMEGLELSGPGWSVEPVELSALAGAVKQEIPIPIKG